MQVKGFAIGWRQIDLEIAGMDNDPYGRIDRQCDAVHKAVGYTDRLDGKRAEVELLPGDDLDQLRTIEQSMLVEFALHIGKRELGGVDGNF